MTLRDPTNFPHNPDVVLERWWEMGDVQTAVLVLFTSATAWLTGEIDWRGYLIVNLPNVGKALWAVMRKGSYREREQE